MPCWFNAMKLGGPGGEEAAKEMLKCGCTEGPGDEGGVVE